MKWIKTRNWIKKRIVVILGMELILLTVFCYAIGTETTAYNRKIAFDAKKVAFTMKDAVVPV